MILFINLDLHLGLMLITTSLLGGKVMVGVLEHRQLEHASLLKYGTNCIERSSGGHLALSN